MAFTDTEAVKLQWASALPQDCPRFDEVWGYLGRRGGVSPLQGHRASITSNKHATLSKPSTLHINILIHAWNSDRPWSHRPCDPLRKIENPQVGITHFPGVLSTLAPEPRAFAMIDASLLCRYWEIISWTLLLLSCRICGICRICNVFHTYSAFLLPQTFL